MGSDIPFFLTGGTAFVSGQGEKIRKLPMPEYPWFLIISPNLNLKDKTAQLYKMVDSSHYTSGALTRKLDARIRGGGDIPPQFFFNVFDEIAPSAFDEIDQIYMQSYLPRVIAQPQLLHFQLCHLEWVAYKHMP